MAIYNVSIVKQLGVETWSNRYVIFAADIAAAKAAGQQIVALERVSHHTTVAFVGMNVANTIKYSTDRSVVGLSGYGESAAAGDALPLEACVRVSLHPATGKPSQKYYRFPLREQHQAGGVLDPDYRTAILSHFGTGLLAIPELKDVDGQTFLSAKVSPRVSNRQMNRRRRSRPGFHRGWVANTP